MTSVPKSTQEQDRKQSLLFENIYGHLVVGAQNEFGVENVSHEPIRIDMKEDRAATGQIAIEKDAKHASFRILMQGELIWIDGTGMILESQDRLRGRKFSTREEALEALITVSKKNLKPPP